MEKLAEETGKEYNKFFKLAHSEGALDAKTKELLHIALVLAMRCEPWAEKHLAVARKMGISERELAETIQLAASVGAGSITAMALRAQKKSQPRIEETLFHLITFS